MNKQRSIEILEDCLLFLKNMTKEELERLEQEKGISLDDYPDENYIDDNFHFINPLNFEDVCSEITIKMELNLELKPTFSFEDSGNIQHNTSHKTAA